MNIWAAVGRLALAIQLCALCVRCSGYAPIPGPRWGFPDWSFAGYAANEYRFRRHPSNFDVTSYGAVGDGMTDCTAAIKQAIAEASANGGGSVYIPAGRFLVTDRIRITTSNITLRGAGKGKTTIYIPKSLTDIDVQPKMLTPIQTAYSWDDAFIQIAGPYSGTANSESRLAKITRSKKRGFGEVFVEDAAKLYVGQWVRIFMSDPASGPHHGTLANALYGNLVKNSTCGESCITGLYGNKDLARWMTRITKIQGRFVTFQRKLPIDVKPEWAPEIHAVLDSTPQHCSISDLRIEFALAPKAVHLMEPGYNGVMVANAVNSYVSNVAVANSDNGVITRFSHHVTVTGVDITVTGGGRTAVAGSFQGHIGIGQYNSADVEVTKFNLMVKMTHDVSVRGSFMSVIHNGRGVDLNLDSHRGGPFSNLYSYIFIGKGSRPFSTGGSPKNGFSAGAYTTFWNLRRNSGKIKIPWGTGSGKCTYGALLAFMGRFEGTVCSDYWFKYTLWPQPSNLFVEQLKRRMPGGISHDR